MSTYLLPRQYGDDRREYWGSKTNVHKHICYICNKCVRIYGRIVGRPWHNVQRPQYRLPTGEHGQKEHHDQCSCRNHAGTR